MKTKLRIKQLSKHLLFVFLIIAFHARPALCRPPAVVDVHPADDSSSRAGLQPRPVYDLTNVGQTEIYTMRGDRRPKKNKSGNETSILYTDADFIDFVSGDVKFIDDAVDDEDSLARYDAVVRDVVKEGSAPRHQVLVPLGDRNLVRKRRQPEQNKPHRRRRRKHRLVLKARDRNHLSEGEEEQKDRRDRFLIKSDSPGYVITSANEVKKDWCRTIPLRQKVSEPHCRSRVIQNNFCYGQCNSFFIPHTGRTDNKVAFQSCAFCKPSKQRWGNVTLNCPGRNPPKVEKTVLFVETCRCITEVFQ